MPWYESLEILAKTPKEVALRILDLFDRHVLSFSQGPLQVWNEKAGQIAANLSLDGQLARAEKLENAIIEDPGLSRGLVLQRLMTVADQVSNKQFLENLSNAEPLLRTALKREGRRVENKAAILLGALPSISETADQAESEPDFFAHFFDECQDVSSSEMQSIWARVLAGEINNPRSFSRRTISALKLLSREEANDFTAFCSCVWTFRGDQYLIRLRPNTSIEEVLPWLGLTLHQIRRLEYANLIHVGTQIPLHVEVGDEIHFFDRIRLRFSGQPHPVLATAPLTFVGRELFPICGAAPSDGYAEKVTKMLSTYTDVVHRHAGPNGVR